MDNKQESTNLFGISAVGEAIKGSLDGVGTFLSKICMPMADEVGLYLRDRTRAFRLKNLINIVEKAQGKLTLDTDLTGLSVHPKVINDLIEHATWNDDETIQNMWAGLLVNSMEHGTPRGKNSLFVNTLKELTYSQARILEFGCRNCKIKRHSNELLQAVMRDVTLEELTNLTEEQDVAHLDSEMDKMRFNNLISGGFKARSVPLTANIAPTYFALQLYAKCQGKIDSISEFYHDQIVIGDDPDFHIPAVLAV